jgi:uncharacterized DUF497 family protein
MSCGRYQFCLFRKKSIQNTVHEKIVYNIYFSKKNEHSFFLRRGDIFYARINIYIRYVFCWTQDKFVWDDDKAAKNWRKHGVRFEVAASVFADPLFVLLDASRQGECRNAAIGFDNTGQLLYVVHLEIENTALRIISARRTDPNEEIHYAF